MKKSELKSMLKPLIKECIKEVIFEDGILSNIVSEVAHGMNGTQIVETRQPQQQKLTESKFAEMRRESLEKQKLKARVVVKETRKQLLDAIGKDSYNGIDLFEGTTPISGPGAMPGSAPEPQGALAGVEPSDPGVDISGLFNLSGGRWKSHIDGK